MLCGIHQPTHGAGYVGLKHVHEESDDVHAMMGVCPQENTLWGCLTGREHLTFFGMLKGLRGRELRRMVADTLRSVRLTSHANKRVESYSGGMRRRLSFANALIGAPTFVMLDEPSTGLDPVSKVRRAGAIDCGCSPAPPARAGTYTHTDTDSHSTRLASSAALPFAFRPVHVHRDSVHCTG